MQSRARTRRDCTWAKTRRDCTSTDTDSPQYFLGPSWGKTLSSLADFTVIPNCWGQDILKYRIKKSKYCLWFACFHCMVSIDGINEILSFWIKLMNLDDRLSPLTLLILPSCKFQDGEHDLLACLGTGWSRLSRECEERWKSCPSLSWLLLQIQSCNEHWRSHSHHSTNTPAYLII